MAREPLFFSFQVPRATRERNPIKRRAGGTHCACCHSAYYFSSLGPSDSLKEKDGYEASQVRCTEEKNHLKKVKCLAPTNLETKETTPGLPKCSNNRDPAREKSPFAEPRSCGARSRVGASGPGGPHTSVQAPSSTCWPTRQPQR